MGDMAEHLDDSYDYADEIREQELVERDTAWGKMADRYSDNARAQVGATIRCAHCDRLVVKQSYQQKFCPPKIQGKRKSYRCKDSYYNIFKPRGKFAHLADLNN